MYFPDNQQQKDTGKQVAGMLPESFEHSQHKAKGHVRTPSKQRHLQQECKTWVITLSWHMLNKLNWQEG